MCVLHVCRYGDTKERRKRSTYLESEKMSNKSVQYFMYMIPFPSARKTKKKNFLQVPLTPATQKHLACFLSPIISRGYTKKH